MPVDHRGATARTTPRWRASAPVIGALVALVSIAILVVSGFTTSSARIAATTESNGLLSAGTVVLTRSDDSAGLVFDAEGLYAGAIVTGCVAVRYDGDVPATLRLSATPDGGSGLDRYIDFQLVQLASGTCPDAATDPIVNEAPAVGTDDRELYAGLLFDFWQTHDSYVSGLPIAEAMTAGDSIAVQATATVVDDNAAAGLDTVLSFTFESRPT